MILFSYLFNFTLLALEPVTFINIATVRLHLDSVHSTKIITKDKKKLARRHY